MNAPFSPDTTLSKAIAAPYATMSEAIACKACGVCQHYNQPGKWSATCIKKWEAEPDAHSAWWITRAGQTCPQWELNGERV